MKKNAAIEDIEALPYEELCAKVEWPLLTAQLKFAESSSVFWREWFRKVGVKSDDIRNLSDYGKLPLSDKKNLLDDQLACPPFGMLPALGLEKVARIHRTSGSAAAPLLVLLSQNDITNTVAAGTRAFRCAGMVPGDLVFHCLNYCMWSGGMTDHQCIEGTGAAVVPFGVGNSKYLIQSILRLKPTGISCTPSYFGRLEQVLREEFDEAPRSLGLKKAFFGGEPGIQDPVYRASLEEKWGVKAIDANYGMSDVLSILGSECEERRGLHYHGQGIVMAELIDEDGCAVPMVAGATGELVFTCLRREVQPLFRYRSHDAVRIVDTGMCGCGRRGFLFNVIGRTDDMVIIKGVNFFPNALQGMFSKLGDELSGEYRVVVPARQEALLKLQVELAQSNYPNKSLEETIKNTVKTEHSVSVEVEFLPAGSLVRSEGKTARLIRK